MKINLMLKYFISILVTLFCTANHTNATVSNDSLKKYGIRIGTDLQKLINQPAHSNTLEFHLMQILDLRSQYSFFQKLEMKKK